MRLVRHPAQFVISVLRFMLLSVYDDVIISFRWICAPLPLLPPLLRRISQSKETRSANVRPLLRQLGPLPVFEAPVQLCKPLTLLTNYMVTPQNDFIPPPELFLNYYHINFSSADEDLFALCVWKCAGNNRSTLTF